GVYNYGYEPQVKEIDAVAGKNPSMSFALAQTGAAVNGPWGVLQIENVQRAAILLNGKTPPYFVGHGDLMNHHLPLTKELLIVPPGTFQVTATRYGKEIYSQPVTVAANERVIIYINKGEIKRETWSDGSQYSNLPRFQAGTASAKIAVAPVSGTFSATPKIYCNDSTKLAWTSQETIDASINDTMKKMDVQAKGGEMLLQPTHTTTYTFEAIGPGGIVDQKATTEVDPVIESTLTPARPEAHYLKLGDKILTNEPAELTWTTLHANDVQLQPVGAVATNGTQSVTPTIDPSIRGEVNVPQNYTLASTNVCGGTDSKTATVNVVGLVEPDIVSVFFPTAYPLPKRPDVGLVGSQQQLLDLLAKELKIYFDHNPEAKIQLTGFADVRNDKHFNQKLSERRAEVVKNYLISQGIPAERIEANGMGKTAQLDKELVKQLEAENPDRVGTKLGDFHKVWMSYNRRVDIILLPDKVESSRFFPHQVPDAPVLSQRACPSLSTIRGTAQ
ncbi:MAG TPA: OmpA family protein, partial [Terriglobales bacterium]|nr:OmpA family protein [Terriglobales bacterium]